MNEMSEHRVTMLGASWRRSGDPGRPRAPRGRAVVGALATLPAAPPRAEFRADLRAPLVAVTPRIVAHGTQARSALRESVPGGQRARQPPARRGTGRPAERGDRGCPRPRRWLPAPPARRAPRPAADHRG